MRVIGTPFPAFNPGLETTLNKSDTNQHPRNTSARFIAWQVLQQLESQKFRLHADDALHEAARTAGLSSNDTSLAFIILSGCLRETSLLSFYIARYSSRPLDAIDPGLRWFLLIALYQILFLDRVADYAAVNETVKMCKKVYKPDWGSFANGILRSILRDISAGRQPSLKNLPLATAFSHPEWLVKKWIGEYGEEETCKILTWNNRFPEHYARSRVPVPELTAALGSNLVQPTPDIDSSAVKMFKTSEVVNSKTFEEGKLYIMQPWSLHAVRQLPLPEKGRVLDMCAAPGGKAIAMADAGSALTVTAVDEDSRRMERLKENIARCRVSNVIPVLLDARECARHFGPAAFDAVLLDAPCTSLGVIQRKPEIRWRANPASILTTTKIQKELLQTAIDCVVPGGYVLYAVCSFSPEETRQIVLPLVEKNEGIVCVKDKLNLPGERNMDGGYWALLQKSAMG